MNDRKLIEYLCAGIRYVQKEAGVTVGDEYCFICNEASPFADLDTVAGRIVLVTPNIGGEDVQLAARFDAPKQREVFKAFQEYLYDNPLEVQE